MIEGTERAFVPKIEEKYFSGKYRVKFGNFVSFSYTYFRAEM